MLALTHHFGNLGLSEARSGAGEDLVFFTVPGLVAYPIWLARVLAVVAAVLFIMVVAAARIPLLDTPHVGALAFLAVLVVGAALAWAAWELLLSMHPESALTFQFPDFEGSAVAMTTIFAGTTAAFIAVAHLHSRWLGVVALAAGALVWWVVLSLAVAFFEPLSSTLTLWPLFGGAAALACSSCGAFSATRRSMPDPKRSPRTQGWPYGTGASSGIASHVGKLIHEWLKVLSPKLLVGLLHRLTLWSCCLGLYGDGTLAERNSPNAMQYI